MFEMFRNFDRQQWLIFIVFSISNFFQAICVSLQAPFYPHEAEKKGATATEYGLVFGIFELTVFIASPIIGSKINAWGARRVFNLGIFTTGSCSILFGLLDNFDNPRVFIALSFLIRIIEAVGNSAFLTSSFTIIARKFPANVGAMFANLETFFGLGLIVGPTVGGGLYQIGGYWLPFVALGCGILFAAAITYFVLPVSLNEPDTTENSNKERVIDLLKVPSICIAVLSLFVASSSIGFLLSSLEPHMRQFGFSPLMMGAMFVVNGGTYALTAPIFGSICDRFRSSPLIINFLGVTATTIAFSFLGPAPFFGLPTLLPVCVAALVLHGFGNGSVLVSSFVISHAEAITSGFSDNINTYGLVSGLWTSTFALGAFVGPTVAGILLDHCGFPWAAMFVVCFGLFFLVAAPCIQCYKHRAMCPGDRPGFLRKKDAGYEEIGESGVADALLGDGSGDQHSLARRQRRSPSMGYDSGSNNSPPDSSGSSEEQKRNSANEQHPPIVIFSPTGPASEGRSHMPLSPKGGKSPGVQSAGSVGLYGGMLGYSVPRSQHGSHISSHSAAPVLVACATEDADQAAAAAPCRGQMTRYGSTLAVTKE